MVDEYFWGCTLTSSNKEFKWEPDELKENGTGDISLSLKGEHCLVLKQALLVGGTEGELNTIEVETSGYKGNVKLPVVSLVSGKVSHLLLDLSFPDPPVTLRLLEGSGPIHIAGKHIIQTEQYQDDDDDDEEDYGLDDDVEEEDVEEENDAEVDIEEKPKGKERGGKKRTNSGPAPAQPSKKKKGAKEDA